MKNSGLSTRQTSSFSVARTSATQRLPGEAAHVLLPAAARARPGRRGHQLAAGGVAVGERCRGPCMDTVTQKSKHCRLIFYLSQPPGSCP